MAVFYKNAGSLEYLPGNLNKEIEKAYQIANEANFSEEELELQHRKRDWVYIQKSSIELASKTGRAEGREEGKLESTRQTVLNLTKENLPLDVIKIATGLTEEEIKAIQEKR